MTIMADRPIVSLVKPKPLAQGTLYDVRVDDLRVGDTIIVGHCVRTISHFTHRMREAGITYRHFTTTTGGAWQMDASVAVMVIR